MTDNDAPEFFGGRPLPKTEPKLFEMGPGDEQTPQEPQE